MYRKENQSVSMLSADNIGTFVLLFLGWRAVI